MRRRNLNRKRRARTWDIKTDSACLLRKTALISRKRLQKRRKLLTKILQQRHRRNVNSRKKSNRKESWGWFHISE